MEEPLIIAVAIYDRGDSSRGRMRQVLEYDAFHWGLLVGPETPNGADLWTFEATDVNNIDPVTFRMTNPALEWQYKFSNVIDPFKSARILGRVAIGVVPSGVLYPELRQLLQTVPLPVRNQEPQQSCVTWAVNAIKLLQEHKWVPEFDMQTFKDRVMAYGDDRMKRHEATEPSLKYNLI